MFSHSDTAKAKLFEYVYSCEGSIYIRVSENDFYLMRYHPNAPCSFQVVKDLGPIVSEQILKREEAKPMKANGCIICL